MSRPVASPPRRRRVHSESFKRELVERCLEPGASVAAIAMAHGVNANLVFGWRRQHLEAAGQCAPVARTTSSAVLLPVSIDASPSVARHAPLQSALPTRPGAGTIDIEIGGAHVRLRGPVDDASLRIVLAALREPA